jgi:FAD/FMN-containing dehydrogenase
MAQVQVITASGTEVSIPEAALATFRSGLEGQLLLQRDSGYDAARKVWNGMVDKRPALIAQCATTTDVVHAVRFARERDLLISVRGGGHNYAGKSVCEGGLLIDLSPMKGLRVDAGRRTARAGGGLRLGEFDRGTQAFGLATTLGVNTDTGIAGLTLGGGYGWLDGAYGLACDNLIAVEIVTADGVVLRASSSEHEDLFWGVRGAGANLGVVTSFEYRLHEVGPVLGGLVLYPFSMAREVLRFFHELSSTAPDELTTVGLLLTAPDGQPAVAVGVCYCGSLDAGERVLKPLRSLGSSLADLIAPRPYTDMQTVFDQAWPPGRRYYHKSHLVRDLSDALIDVVIAYAEAMPTPVSSIYLQQLHGRASRVTPTDTAFPHRYDHYSGGPHPGTDNPAEVDKMVEWARACWQAMQPFVERAVYVNALEDHLEEGDQRLRDAYGTNYGRLAALKKKYDGTNFFRSNQNIRPT